MAYIGKSPTGTGVRQRYYFTATGGETSLSGTDDNGLTLSYSDGAYVDVLLNGIELVAGTDYNTTTANTIAGLAALAASDVVTVTVYDIFTVADTVSAKDGGTFSGNVNMNGNLTVDGGTIKLDGNYPVGTDNVALGDTALDSNVSGGSNTAIGAGALTANTASNNTAVGYQAGYSNTTGDKNVTLGGASGYDNTTGRLNTFVGYNSGANNTTANSNTFMGESAGFTNTTGQYNTAIGQVALALNTTANQNTAVGYQAAYNNTTGSNNTCVGKAAGYSATTGANNTFVGTGTGYSTTGSGNTFIGNFGSTGGYGSGYYMTSGNNNTIIGAFTGNSGGLDIRTSSNNIVLSDGDGNPRAYYNLQWHLLQPDNNRYHSRLITTGSHATPYGPQISYSDTAPDNRSGRFLTCSDSSTTRLIIYNDGDVENHDNSYGGISDEKVKEQIIDASSQWDDIKSLTVRKFKFKSDVVEKGDSDEHWRLGVIAQEVESAGMAGLVAETPDTDDEGNDLGTVTKAVKYSILYMKAVKALQEAMDRIETLEAKVTALENA